MFGDIGRDCTSFGCEGDGTAHLPGPGTGRLYDADDGFVRHWDGWETPGTYGRVFVYDLAEGSPGGIASSSGVAVDGPAGAGALVADTPTKPFGGGEEIAWAPDGDALYFAARRTGREEPLSTNIDIYRSALDGNAPVNLTEENEATDTLPAPSPDGKWLAYVAMERPGYESDRLVVHLRDLATGRTRALTDGFDRSFGSLAWTPDSRWIVATAQDVLDTPAFRIDPRNGRVERLDLMAGNEAHIGNVVPLAGNRLLFTRDSIASPAELYLSQDWSQGMPLTAVARPAIGQLAGITTTRFSFEGAGGDTVWGQITKPERHDGRVPAILYVHGGPQGSFNDGWSSRWNPRVLASQGYAVISVDFHGSTGYGQAFTDSINRDWGGKPLEDLQKGLAAALARDPQIDGDRACAMGASYGGYMMNWIAGQWPDRFDCLIQHDGLFDMRSFYYATEELWFPRWDFGGSYAENPAEYEKFNPVNYVKNWRTPMLVITGEKDFRVPYTQGLQSFTALQEQGVPSKLLVFPDENHWVLKPANSLQWHNTVFDWLATYLKKPGIEPSGPPIAAMHANDEQTRRPRQGLAEGAAGPGQDRRRDGGTADIPVRAGRKTEMLFARGWQGRLELPQEADEAAETGWTQAGRRHGRHSTHQGGLPANLRRRTDRGRLAGQCLVSFLHRTRAGADHPAASDRRRGGRELPAARLLTHPSLISRYRRPLPPGR